MIEIAWKNKHHFLSIILLSLFSFLFTTIAKADPPSRVARISYLNGSVSFSPAGQTQWMYATYNRPLTKNDRLWTDASSRAELQLGAATVRLNNSTALTIVNLDDNNAQFSLSQGSLNLRVWLIRVGQVYEIDTPNLSLMVRKPGDYRIDVHQNNTLVRVRSGQGEIYGPDASYLIQAPQACQFSGAVISNYQCNGLGAPDDFDQWCYARNNLAKNSVSARYVSREVIGYQDLDNYGNWSFVPGYGYAWTPNDVPSGWAPYRYGQWVWIAPWGWTWVDNSPWGFAPYHYGRWAYVKNNWYWVPGGFDRRPVYAPALVVFVGNFQISIGGSDNNNIGWFPLGPGEVYYPSYRVSKDYFTYVNVNNTTINNTYITQIYNKPPKNVVYQNKTIVDAVSVVPQQDFFKSKAVKDVLLKMPNEDVLKSQIISPAIKPPVIDNKVNVNPISVQPPEQVFTQPTIKFKPGKGQSFPKLVTLEPKPITPTNKSVQPLSPSSTQPLKSIIQPSAGLTPPNQPAEKNHAKHQALPPVTSPQSLTPSSGAPIPPPGAFGPSSPTSQPSGMTPSTPPAQPFHPKHKTLQPLSPTSGPAVAPTTPASPLTPPLSSSLAPTTSSGSTPSAPSSQEHLHKHKEWSQTQPVQPQVNPPSITPPQPAPITPPPVTPVAPATPPPVTPAAPATPTQMNFGESHKQTFGMPAPTAAAPTPQASPTDGSSDDKKHKDKDKDNGQSTVSN